MRLYCLTLSGTIALSIVILIEVIVMVIVRVRAIVKEIVILIVIVKSNSSSTAPAEKKRALQGTDCLWYSGRGTAGRGSGSRVKSRRFCLDYCTVQSSTNNVKALYR